MTHYSKFQSNPQLFANTNAEDPFHHSRQIDLQLGFQIDQVESLLSRKYSAYNISSPELLPYPGGEAWIGLGPQVLQTPYQEIFEALEFLKVAPPKHLVDLGAGYARLHFPLSALYPNCKFTGHEFVDQRVAEGRRVLELNELDPTTLEKKNILSPEYELPKADTYFIYDFGNPHDIKKLLELFIQRFENENFFLIVKGKATRSMIHNKFPLLFRAYGAVHFKNLSLYSSFYQLSD